MERLCGELDGFFIVSEVAKEGHLIISNKTEYNDWTSEHRAGALTWLSDAPYPDWDMR